MDRPMGKTERQKHEAREERKAARQAWVQNQPKEERHRIATFGICLVRTAEKSRYKVTTEGISRFLRLYIDKGYGDEWRHPDEGEKTDRA